jgi:hypothetical protein
MTNWNWRCVAVDPNAILDAAKTLPVITRWFEIDLAVGLTPSAEYLSFATRFLTENTALARDATVCYAKRAVCREIDAFMICNHLSAFLGCNYPVKIDMLSEIALPVFDVVRDLVIDPRNDVEHKYVIPTAIEAKHAVQIAEMFMKSIVKEQGQHAIISLAPSISFQRKRCSEPGNEYDRLVFTLDKRHKPMLLIDPGSADSVVMVIHPGDEEVTICPLSKFERKEAIALAKLLREHYGLPHGGMLVDRVWLSALKTQLGLPNI